MLFEQSLENKAEDELRKIDNFSSFQFKITDTEQFVDVKPETPSEWQNSGLRLDNWLDNRL